MPQFVAHDLADGLPRFHALMAVLNCHGLIPFLFGHCGTPRVAEDEAMLLALIERTRGDDTARTVSIVSALVTAAMTTRFLADIDGLARELVGSTVLTPPPGR